MKSRRPVQSLGSRRALGQSRPAMSRTVVELLATTAGHRIRTHRNDRHRAVYVYRPSPVDQESTPDETGTRTSAVTARLHKLREHEPFNRVGGTVLRPVADATNTLNILREIVRGPR